MCGICGIVDQDRESPIDVAALLSMRDTLEHRGPDDAGLYVGQGIGLGTRRLKIIDLSDRGHMPMGSPDGRYWITYNGEIYNYRELRADLQGKGYEFRSNTDTEVLLYLYIEEGPAALHRLNGMFAFGIWDNAERELFLARDRVGVKPLFYSIVDGSLLFASEEKSLFAGGMKAEFDPDVWDELICFRHIAGERTAYRGVRRLLPGHSLTWKNGVISIKRWWSLLDRVPEVRESLPRDPVAWFRDTFDNSTQLETISDVPVGVLLSGGLDSSSVAASLAAQGIRDLASFTVRFDEPEYDEGPLAHTVARRWGLNYHELVVRRTDLLELLSQAAWQNDAPLAHGNDPHLLAIAQYAAPLVTVLLSGEGADETLGGYVRYKPLRSPHLLNAARTVFPSVARRLRLNRRLTKLARFLRLGTVDRFVFFSACEVLPLDLSAIDMEPVARFDYREQILDEARTLYPGDFVRQAMYSDQHTFLCSILDRNDRMTMGASIECRVPFLDHNLIETLAALPSSSLFADRSSKPLLRKSIGRRLPESVMKHRKWGFAVPWGQYLRQVPVLRDLVDCLPALSPIKDGPFNPIKLRKIVNDFQKGDETFEALVLEMAMIAIWWQACIAGRGTKSPASVPSEESESSRVTA